MSDNSANGDDDDLFASLDGFDLEAFDATASKAPPSHLSSPYPGLRPFEKDEWEIFKGRDKQIAALIDLLDRKHFIAVVGPSGCGKSSLVKAGLIPHLEGGEMFEAGLFWLGVVMTPGEGPLHALALALIDSFTTFAADVAGQDVDPELDIIEIEALLSRPHVGLVDAIAHCKKACKSRISATGDAQNTSRINHIIDETNILVIVDQFEELFRYGDIDGHDIATDFVDLLLYVRYSTPAKSYVLLTMRTDHLGDCGKIPHLSEAINDSFFLVPNLSDDDTEDTRYGRMPRKDLSAAIVDPLEEFDATIEPALVERIKQEIVHSGQQQTQSDYLPLMQHALMRMWDQKATGAETPLPGIQLGTEDFIPLYGDGSALARHAADAYEQAVRAAEQNSLPRAEAERFIKILFQSLVVRRGVEQQQDVRRPARFADIVAVAGWDADDTKKKAAHDVVDVFRRKDIAFIRPFLPSEIGEENKLDITHESLIRQWDKIKSWIDEESELVEEIRSLIDNAKRWDSTEKWTEDQLSDNRAKIEHRYELWDNARPHADWARYNGIGSDDFALARRFLEAQKEWSDKELNRQSRRKAKNVAVYLGLALVAFVISGLILWNIENSDFNEKLAAKTEFSLHLLALGEYRNAVTAAQNRAVLDLHKPDIEKTIRKEFTDNTTQIREELRAPMKSLVDNNGEGVLRWILSRVRQLRRPAFAVTPPGIAQRIASAVLPGAQDYASYPTGLIAFEEVRPASSGEAGKAEMFGAIGVCGEVIVMRSENGGKVEFVGAWLPNAGPANERNCLRNAGRDANLFLKSALGVHRTTGRLIAVSPNGTLTIVPPFSEGSDFEALLANASTNRLVDTDSDFDAVAIANSGNLIVTAKAKQGRLTLTTWRIEADDTDFLNVRKDSTVTRTFKGEIAVMSLDFVDMSDDYFSFTLTNLHSYVFQSWDLQPAEKLITDEKEMGGEYTGLPREVFFTNDLKRIFVRDDNKVQIRSVPSRSNERYLGRIESKQDSQFSAMLHLDDSRLALGETRGEVRIGHIDRYFSEVLATPIGDEEADQQAQWRAVMALARRPHGGLVGIDQNWRLALYDPDTAADNLYEVKRVRNAVDDIATEPSGRWIAISYPDGGLEIKAVEEYWKPDSEDAYWTPSLPHTDRTQNTAIPACPKNRPTAREDHAENRHGKLDFLGSAELLARVEGGNRKRIRVWRFETGDRNLREMGTIEHPAPVLDFSYDIKAGRLVAVLADGQLHATLIGTGNATLVSRRLPLTDKTANTAIQGLSAADFNSEKGEIAVGTRDGRIFRGRTDGLAEVTDHLRHVETNGPITGIAFSPDGRYLAAISSQPRNMQASGKPVGGNTLPVTDTSSAEGKNALFVVDLEETREEADTVKMFRNVDWGGPIVRLSFGPNSQQIAVLTSSSYSNVNSFMQIIDIESEIAILPVEFLDYVDRGNYCGGRFKTFALVCSSGTPGSKDPRECFTFTPLPNSREVLSLRWKL